jgi:hypothetical protein
MVAVRGGLQPDLLATVSAEIDARLRDLRVAVREYEQLLSAADALEAERQKPTTVRSQAPAVRKVPAARKSPTQRRGPLALKASLAPKARIARKPPAPKAVAVRSPKVIDRKASAVVKEPVAVKEPAVVKPARAKAVAPKKEPAPARPKRGESEQAIVAALEHGSHTLAELAIVTGIVAPALRDGLRGLQKAKKITKAKREGKAAYALAG